MTAESINNDEHEITLIVDMEEGHVFEYRLWANSGSITKINSVKMEIVD